MERVLFIRWSESAGVFWSAHLLATVRKTAREIKNKQKKKHVVERTTTSTGPQTPAGSHQRHVNLRVYAKTHPPTTPPPPHS